MIPRATSAERAAVNVPTFFAFGDQDLTTDYMGTIADYHSLTDLAVLVLGQSGHCHNQSSGRRLLWDRLLSWMDGVGLRDLAIAGGCVLAHLGGAGGQQFGDLLVVVASSLRILSVSCPATGGSADRPGVADRSKYKPAICSCPTTGCSKVAVSCSWPVPGVLNRRMT